MRLLGTSKSARRNAGWRRESGNDWKLVLSAGESKGSGLPAGEYAASSSAGPLTQRRGDSGYAQHSQYGQVIGGSA